MNKSTIALDASHLILLSPPLPSLPSTPLFSCCAQPNQVRTLTSCITQGKSCFPHPLASWHPAPPGPSRPSICLTNERTTCVPFPGNAPALNCSEEHSTCSHIN